ncbi:hypothetical protein V8E53_006380 [Lactarius tabidus]
MRSSHLSLRDYAGYQPSRAHKEPHLRERTPLYDYHLQHGVKMVPFAGYHIPLVYDDVRLSAKALIKTCVRAQDYLTLDICFRGAMATDFLEYLTPSSLLILEPYASTIRTPQRARRNHRRYDDHKTRV